MSQFFFDKSVIIRRLRKIDQYRTAISATFTAFQGSLQIMSDDKAQLAGYEIGKTFTLYTDALCPMKEADEAIVDGKKYSVAGVSDDTFTFGSLSHKRYRVVKEQD